MHRLSRAILAVVVVFVLLVAATLFAKSRTMPAESADPAPSNADLHIKEVKIEEDSGAIRWQLRAEQALVFEGEGRTHLRKIVVDVHQPDRSWNIVGEEGDLFQPAQDVEIRRNVVLTSSDGLRLETSVLRWQGGEKRLWTDVPVKMSRPGTLVLGSALDVRMEDDKASVAGPVKATFVATPRNNTP
jgi:LPS export ABC transporter protein LptC